MTPPRKLSRDPWVVTLLGAWTISIVWGTIDGDIHSFAPATPVLIWCTALVVAVLLRFANRQDIHR